MDPSRTNLLAQNGMPGEYIVSYPFIERAPPPEPRRRTQPDSETRQRRDSVDSLESIAREKEEAQTVQSGRSGLRSAFSKVARRLSGAGKEKAVDAGEGEEGEGRKHAPIEVYVLGNQVMYFLSSDCRSQRSERRREKRGKGPPGDGARAHRC